MAWDNVARERVRREPNRRIVCAGCGKRARPSPVRPTWCRGCQAAYYRAWYVKHRTARLAHIKVYDKKRRATDAFRKWNRAYQKAWKKTPAYRAWWERYKTTPAYRQRSLYARAWRARRKALAAQSKSE